MWHRRLGHASEEVIKKTIPIAGSLKFCEGCMESKFDRRPFNDEVQREKSLLERVYSDVCGPMEETSLGGARYYVSFIDGYSRMADVYLIRSKDEVFQKFLEYLKII